MLDKKVSKAYRKVKTAENEYKAFQLINRMSPTLAKKVLIKYVMQEKKV
ncbi:hypothetical protein [Gracilibacillus sp. YIM 98692]|nr:hypothetical protein [Gracilibacillus sp. YIM 98692]